MKKKILIIQTAFIGDVILATSLVEELVKLYPGSEIDFLLRKGNESLLAQNPHLQEVYVWDKKKNKLKNLFFIITRIRKKRYDLVLNIQRFFSSGLVTLLSKANTKIGFKPNPLSHFFSHRVEHKIPFYYAGEMLHEVQRNYLLLRPLLAEEFKLPAAKSIPPRLYPSQQDQKLVDNLGFKQAFVVIAPSSVWFTKQWPLNKWRELIERIGNEKLVLLIGAQDDREYCQGLAKDFENVQNLCGKLNLLQSCELMARAQRVFVNDSAPLHLASAANAPVSAVFNSTLPEFGFYPLSHKDKVVQVEKLDCRPCGIHGRRACPLKHFDCAQKIDVNELWKSLDE